MWTLLKIFHIKVCLYGTLFVWVDLIEIQNWKRTHILKSVFKYVFSNSYRRVYENWLERARKAGLSGTEKNILKNTFLPGQEAQLFGACPMHRKVAGLIPGRVHPYSAGSIPGRGEYGRQLMFLSHQRLSLSPRRRPFLSKINKHILGWRFKNK